MTTDDTEEGRCSPEAAEVSLHDAAERCEKWYTEQGSCSRDWSTTAAVAEYKYVWRGNRTKSFSDFMQL